MLERITPLVLTRNEAPNVGRVLDRLRWAERVVVVDSLSEDATRAIARGFANVELHQRPFDDHARQYTFALKETGIATEWVLALDADYLLTPELVAEIAALDPTDAVSGYAMNFTYCVHGRPLRGCLYPPKVRLYRRGRTRFRQDGHTEVALVDGRIERLRHPILHDDRKALSAWIASQDRYMALEAAKLAGSRGGTLDLADRLRRWKLAPALMLPYCLLGKRLILDGAPGVHYALQRTLAEAILALHLLERELRGPRRAEATQGGPAERASPTRPGARP